MSQSRFSLEAARRIFARAIESDSQGDYTESDIRAAARELGISEKTVRRSIHRERVAAGTAKVVQGLRSLGRAASDAFFGVLAAAAAHNGWWLGIDRYLAFNIAVLAVGGVAAVTLLTCRGKWRLIRFQLRNAALWSGFGAAVWLVRYDPGINVNVTSSVPAWAVLTGILGGLGIWITGRMRDRRKSAAAPDREVSLAAQRPVRSDTNLYHLLRDSGSTLAKTIRAWRRSPPGKVLVTSSAV